MNIKQAPQLKSQFKGQSKENFIRFEPLLKCHLSEKATFSMSQM